MWLFLLRPIRSPAKKTNPFASAEGCTNFCPPKNENVPQNFSQGDKLSPSDQILAQTLYKWGLGVGPQGGTSPYKTLSTTPTGTVKTTSSRHPHFKQKRRKSLFHPLSPKIHIPILFSRLISIHFITENFSWETLTKDQSIFPSHNLSLDYLLLFLGENWFWSLLRASAVYRYVMLSFLESPSPSTSAL